MRYGVDIETALYNKLTEEGISASAHRLPASLGVTLAPLQSAEESESHDESEAPEPGIPALPHVHVTRTGGYTTDMVIEENNVDFDVYAEDQADAMTAAAELCGWVRELAGQEIGSPCYTSEVITLPYENPDPRHPTLGRATFKAQIRIRTKE